MPEQATTSRPDPDAYYPPRDLSHYESSPEYMLGCCLAVLFLSIALGVGVLIGVML